MDYPEEINLHVEGQVFTVKKELLCEHSDYFRAMFSGNYVEKEQKDISIDMVDANSMKIILKYMDIGLIDISDYTQSVIGNLAMTANFLQVTELMKQIEYCLDIKLSLSNWMETMTLAEQLSYSKLQHLSAAFGLLSFKKMLPKYISTIDKLFWYLSHPYLEHENELQVFKFGFDWVTQAEACADALLIVLGCLDFYKITKEDLEVMVSMINDYRNSLAEKVIHCLKWLSNENSILLDTITSKKTVICEKFTERVYMEVLFLIKENKQRKRITYTPTIPMWVVKDDSDSVTRKLEYFPHYLYTFKKEVGFTKWLEVAEKNLWGWCVVSWGPTRIVIVCGEHGRGTGIFMKDVKVYDTLRKEWINHGVQLPARRHGGVHVMDDSLFVIGGVGGFRVVLDSGFIYNLKERTYRKIAKLPDPIQSPAICSHKGKIYSSGVKHVYQYDDSDQRDRWKRVIETDIRPNRLVSFKEYIYVTQSYFRQIYRFKPDVSDGTLEMVHAFTSPAAAICSFSDHLLVFTKPNCPTEPVTVEKFKEDNVTEVVWSNIVHDMLTDINDVSGSCNVVLSLPSLDNEISEYHQRYVSRYSHIVINA